jgi:acetoin utilization deacetylase AcuC-like enzyme
MEVAMVASTRFADHDTGQGHPERADRIRAIARGVRAAGLVHSADPFPDFTMHATSPGAATALATTDGSISDASISDVSVVEFEPVEATDADLLLVHPQRHIDRVRQACASSSPLDEDTICGPGSESVARLSAGAAIRAAELVIEASGVSRAFCAARPPGHHAESDRSMGFCLFNNIAIATRHLQIRHGVGRVAIVDFDVHHGNGTQEAFYSDPTVLFISIHQHPATLYPGTGYSSETGTGEGVGYTLNVPMSPGADDAAYKRAFEQTIMTRIDGFRPEVLLISAGFDAHADDSLAQVLLSDDGFSMMSQMLVQVAKAHCGGRLVSVLEGGYNLDVLSRCVVRHLVDLAK